MFNLVEKEILEYLRQHKALDSLVVAYSGGVDSRVLLDVAYSAYSGCDEIKSIRAIHVNHGLNAASDSWQEHCVACAGEYPLALHVEQLNMNPDLGSVEEQARNLRYQCFEAQLRENELLLLGHHEQDQAETLMLNLFRGSGPRGLSGMPRSRSLGKSHLYRPFLHVTKHEILSYAKEYQLVWIEDDSNKDVRFSRNLVRTEVMPKLEERWPKVQANIVRSAELAFEYEELSEELAVLDLDTVIESDAQESHSRWGASLPVKILQDLSRVRVRNLLRYWLRQHRVSPPSYGLLRSAVEDFFHAAENKDSKLSIDWRNTGAHVSLKYFDDRIFLYTQKLDAESMIDTPAFVEGEWDLKSSSSISLAQGVLKVGPAKQGLSSKITQLHIRYRDGGERCCPSERSHSQTLKKLLQEYKVPPWYRDNLPLVYCGDELVAVADLWICKEHLVEEEGAQAFTYEVSPTD